MSVRFGSLKVAFICASLAAYTLSAQVYQVGQGAAKGNPRAKNTQSSSSNAQSLGWGSNIQNARLARAAETALRRGDYASAVSYAQRASQAAPNDPQLWFLLGYAARLDDKYQLAIDAYNHGLQIRPSAPDGLSGLAQVDSLTGRTQAAERLLQQVVSANPGRRDDVLLLGNLYMQSNDYADAVKWLTKAETDHPGARSELLLALSYQQLNQMDLAHRYLTLAKEKAPHNPDVQRSLAGYYRAVGRYREAISALKSIQNPKPDLIAELAYTYQLDNQMKESAKLYLQAANEEQKNFDLQVAAAQAQVVAGSIDRANALLNRAGGLNGKTYRLHAVRAEIAQMQHHDEDAIREYRAAIAGLPALPSEGPLYGIQLHMDLVALYRQTNEADAAHSELAIAETEIGTVNEAGSDKEKYLRLKSLIELNAGNFDEALSDVKQALSINEHSHQNLQLEGDVLMKLGRTQEAIAAYKRVLTDDPNNPFALISVGYACRAAGDDRDAEKYFKELQKADPKSTAPYLALGDLYTAHKDYAQAQTAYSEGYKMSPDNALIVAGGMNAAVEAHNLKAGGLWKSRVTSKMKQEPEVLREEERYLSFDGKYKQSAEIGEEAIKKLPKDRDVVVYLGYDLLHMGKYDELSDLTSKYLNILPKEPDIPLLAGYVHKHQGNDKQALQDFTEVLKRDPSVVTAYVNRGYVLNDLHEPRDAASNFKEALKRDPKDNEAHLGLAYADLDLDNSQEALRQAELAERAKGDSRDIHVIKATAYGREGMVAKSATEYRAALKFTPNDSGLRFGLGNALFSERQYQQAIGELEAAEKLSPHDAHGYALLARCYANLQDQAQTVRYVRLAEVNAARDASRAKNGSSEESEILLSTGDALGTLGEEQAAMERFRRALGISRKNRVGVRLAIAGVMARQGRTQDAEREVALAWMEVQTGDASPPTGSQFVEAADVFSTLHEYQLSQSYLERAKAAGAPDNQVRIALATDDLALGETTRARAELAAVDSETEGPPNYQYLVVKANLFSQEHENGKALTAFAQASNAAGADQASEEQMLQTAANEGLRVTPMVSALSEFSVAPIFEDTTVYVLDSKLDSQFPVPSSDTALLPPPRSSIQTEWTDAFHLHLWKLPTPSGFFQLRNARGQISVPSLNSVVKRNTTDATFNFGLNPTIHVGQNIATFNAGVQETLRRDSETPTAINQNLFRLYSYMSTSSFFNSVSMNGHFIWEKGPFTEIKLHSRNLVGALNFRVGTPWGKTALITGWGVNELLFEPANIEDHYTSSYVGLERRFSQRVNVRAMVEDLRAWRVTGGRWAIAQNLRPAGEVDFKPASNWDVHISTAYSSNRGFHVYDATENSISISHAWPFHRMFQAETGPVALRYPIRFSAGVQEETFFNFPGSRSEQFRPYVQINIF